MLVVASVVDVVEGGTVVVGVVDVVDGADVVDAVTAPLHPATSTAIVTMRYEKRLMGRQITPHASLHWRMVDNSALAFIRS